MPKSEIYRRQAGFFMLVGYRLDHAFSVPIQHLVGQLSSIDGTDRFLRVADVSENEIGYIVKSINAMLDKIHDMGKRSIDDQKRMHTLELSAKEAELQSLQAQINSHFMYNTLECLRSLGMDYNAPEIVESSTALADILRYSLHGDNTVELSREIGIIREYLKIVRLRFNDRYAIEMTVQDEALPALIIKMILQPIVENAVFHGLEEKKTGDRTIECRVSGERLAIVVEDNGNGIDTASLETLQRSLQTETDRVSDFVGDRRCTGLLNIHRRIRTYYGPPFGLSLESKLAERTAVFILLPFIVEAVNGPVVR